MYLYVARQDCSVTPGSPPFVLMLRSQDSCSNADVCKKPMQIKPRQTGRHLGGDRRRLDGEATASVRRLFPDGDVITRHAVCSVTRRKFECLLLKFLDAGSEKT